MPTITIPQLHAKKAAGEKFAVLTAYDATFARVASEAGIEALLIGDSLGMVLQGHNSTLPVTVTDMAYHTATVSRGNVSSLIIADLPFGGYSTTTQTLDNAATLMRAGAHAVKLEGGLWLAESIRLLTERGIPVCGHLGLTPQSVNTFGGYKVQGRQPEQARRIIEDAKAVEAAGATLLVLECVPRALGAQVSAALKIPVIGIGAGPGTDAQVLVLHDMLGLNSRPPKFVRNFMQGADGISAAIAAYHAAVLNGSFPGAEHTFE
ncbi:MAG: 3-methyl-2-oxobutanoate hydroxymethyltransferase [Verrucomicrobiaceae bacterium]|nr:3-methyl-2-oxobutanoate hydroxymethyltransferase [Verrucomicrobiaceae bacterium]